MLLVEILLRRRAELVARLRRAGARRRFRLHHRLWRRPDHRLGAQPARAAAGPARAVRRGRARWWCSPSATPCTPPASSRSISPAWWSATAQTRAHNSVVVFLDAVTWLAQIVMFVLLGLLAWPRPAGAAASSARSSSRLVLMLIARPAAVFLCLAPFGFQLAREAVHLLGRPARRGRDLPRLDPAAGRLAGGATSISTSPSWWCCSSLLVQGWTVALAARKLDMSFARNDPLPRRVELDLPGQLDARDRRLSGAGQQPVSCGAG